MHICHKRLKSESVQVLAWDGVPLSVMHYGPQEANGKVALINSGIGVRQCYYENYASYLAAQGFHVYTFDYRGIGGSRTCKLKLLNGDMKDWGVLDLDAVISYITAKHDQMRLVIIGHSIGGQLIGMSRLAKKADVFIMIGSQTPYWKNHNSSWMKAKLVSFWYFFIPFFTNILGYFPASRLGLFEDLPANVARQWARWAKTPNYIFEDHPELKNNFESLEQQSLWISFTDDTMAPYKAVLDLRGFFTRLKSDHWHLNPEDVLQKKVGHYGFFRKKMEDVLWHDTTKWIYAALLSQRNKAA